METVKNMLAALRLKQWVKNFFVIAPLFFSQKITEVPILARVSLAFFVFCLLSSSTYLINDVFDIQEDKNHPEKSKRPVASGKVSVTAAISLSVILLLVAVVCSRFIGRQFLGLGLTYWAINIFYTFYLRRLPILDVICIASGFVLRVIAGGIAVTVPASRWIFVTTMFLSLFLGFAKRRGEIDLSGNNQNQTSRAVLKSYSIELLDQFLVICAAAAIMSYALFALSDYALARFGTYNLIYTIPFVIYGVFRYFYLIHFSRSYENPTEVLFKDKPLVFTVILWVICALFIIAPK